MSAIGQPEVDLATLQNMVTADTCEWPQCGNNTAGHATFDAPCECQPWGWYALCGQHHTEAVESEGDYGFSECAKCSEAPVNIMFWRPV